jgi:hypothetical protein
MVSLCHMTKDLNFCINNIVIINLYKSIMYVLKIDLIVISIEFAIYNIGLIYNIYVLKYLIL